MNNESTNQERKMTISENSHSSSRCMYQGQKWLVEERDACGVGFIAHRRNQASHEIIEKALSALTCLEHRGGCSADRDSGDGAGVLTAIPWQLFQQSLLLNKSHTLIAQNIDFSNNGKNAIGVLFLPQDAHLAEKIRNEFERVASEEKLTVLGWREVPVNPNVLGVQARENLPLMQQVLLVSEDKSGDELERILYLVRRRLVKAVKNIYPDFYVASLSSRTIVYKGMVRSAVLGDFYDDLKNPAFTSAFAVYHRRFSTNTMPKWHLAQPMRLLGHNGEINTLLGNINWMTARESSLNHPIWENRFDELKPFVQIDNSDSATLDNVFEVMVRSGRSPLEALAIMVPEAYNNQPELRNYPEIVDFYEYYSGMQEAWDGPALLVFSDGQKVGATLDRNGLRPARYFITKDDYIVVASEAGVVEFPEEDIIEKGRLGPGEMIAVDLETSEILKNWEIKQRIAKQHPYGEWLRKHRQELTLLVNGNSSNGNGNGNGNSNGNGNGHLPSIAGHALNGKGQIVKDKQPVNIDRQNLLRQQTAFGYSSEDVEW